MSRCTRPALLVVAFLLAATSQPPLAAAAPAAPLACDPDGTQASGAVYRICMPASFLWNHDLVVYAHGYVSPTEPIGIPEEQMVLDGVSIADLVTAMGYGFATTSYSTNGLAVLPGIEDLVDLVDIFTAAKGATNRVYLVGVSEGGLMTALAIERRADVFDGGLAACGLYGDFRYQTDYLADGRVLFDYFFPDLMPPTPVDVPGWRMDDWDSYYATTIQPEIEDPANASQVDQLLNVAQAAFDPADTSTKEETIQSLLWYNVFATNDGRTKLGGQPFENQSRAYSGSDDDTELNLEVQRFTADQAALDEIAAHYQTTGVLSVPLVTLHNTGDPLVPYWHATHYRAKAFAADNVALHEHYAVGRYGHCNFTASEVLTAFNRLVAMVNDPPAYRPVQRAFLPAIVRAP